MSKRKPLPEPPSDSRWQQTSWRSGVRRAILRWFEGNARDLPWRKTDDPYAVWISEIMLQQTQVVTVIPFFERFLQRFPDVSDLATADEEEVLRYWEGLGYYRRARQMHAAARQVVVEHDARFPEDFDSVLALPGIGRYTAGAILSISRDKRLPVVEANTLRLYSRLIALRDVPTKTASQKLLWEFAESVLPKIGSGQFNQAAMELGSLVCTPREPDCIKCPLSSRCATFELGAQAEIPGKVKKIQYEQRSEMAVVVRSKGQVLVRRCGPTERWAGLWDFPRFETDADADPELTAMERMVSDFGQKIKSPSHIKTIKHGVTKYRITLKVIDAMAAGARKRFDTDEICWMEPDKIHELPLSTTGRKISQLLSDAR